MGHFYVRICQSVCLILKKIHTGQGLVTVAHLWSYTNTSITDIAGNTMVGAYTAEPSADVTASSRFGKSSHISMISNSVTHLRSYTNSAIADIAGNSVPISPVTLRDRRRLRIERRYRRIE